MKQQDADELHRFLRERLALQLANLREGLIQLSDPEPQESLIGNIPAILSQLDALEREAVDLADRVRGSSQKG